MTRGSAFGLGMGVLVVGGALAAAPLVQVSPGLWEISGVPGAKAPARECVADAAVLVQYEHRRQTCSVNVVRETADQRIVQYSCPGGGFGRSELKVITPRSLRIQTQGISDNLPFQYTLQARRVGDCPSQSTAARH